MDLSGLEERQWCEYAVPNLLPALRAGIAQTLSRRYGMSQRQIARRLGLSQAAVSHYTTSRRAATPLRDHTGLSKYVEKLADRVATGLSGTRLTAAICGICTSFRRGEDVEPCFCLSSGVSRPEFLSRPGDGSVGQPCEAVVVKRLLPFIRSEVAHRLSEKRAQQRVASDLGVTQPAVSHYLSSRREDMPLDRISGFAEHVAKLADRLLEGIGPEERKGVICRLCVEARRGGVG